jgi:hypothetical protein
MKKIISNIVFGIPLVILILISLVFVFIEGRLLVSLDWTIYDNAFNGFIRYFFRLLIAVICIFTAILEFINMKKSSKTIEFYLNNISIGLLCSSIIVLITATNYAGLAVFGVIAFYSLIRWLRKLIVR